MTLLIFAATLLLAVLVSDLAERSVLSTAVLFLVVGFVAGGGYFGVVAQDPSAPMVEGLAELALFSVLFTDGMRVGVKDLLRAWRLPGRALLLGLPLTLVGAAVLGKYVVGLSWPEAFLVGAVLSPTDPVFASAIVGREEVPGRLRHLLNVESGLNDGLALPIVVTMLSVAGTDTLHPLEIAAEVVGGVALGVVVPWLAIALERTRFFSAYTTYQPLNGFAIGLLVLGIAKMTGANEFLAAFSAGVTIASVGPEVRDTFHRFGELLAELLKLAALLVFGALISPKLLAAVPLAGYLFVLLGLVAVRPLALTVSLARSELDWRERFAAAWFGPKGFASVVFGLLILKRAQVGRFDPERADLLFSLIALSIVGSILAHSSTDVVVAKWFARVSERKKAAEEAEEPPS